MIAETRILQELNKRFLQYKDLGDKTLAQIEDSFFHYQPNEHTNSIAIIIQHLHGNMKSRFTDFLTTDGEKEWRNRDTEFTCQQYSPQQLKKLWEEGWQILINTLESLPPQSLSQEVFIRKEPLTVTDALFRQLAHYSYHVGQIIQVAKSLKNTQWQSLSIPIGQSNDYNQSDGIKDPANKHLPKKS